MTALFLYQMATLPDSENQPKESERGQFRDAQLKRWKLCLTRDHFILQQHQRLEKKNHTPSFDDGTAASGRPWTKENYPDWIVSIHAITGLRDGFFCVIIKLGLIHVILCGGLCVVVMT